MADKTNAVRGHGAVPHGYIQKGNDWCMDLQFSVLEAQYSRSLYRLYRCCSNKANKDIGDDYKCGDYWGFWCCKVNDNNYGWN